MNCEEFAMAGLDLRAGDDGPAQRAALEHLRECPRCAALHENWQALRADLQAVGAESRDESAPARVEMRLRQEFRSIHKTEKSRRTVMIAGWALAAAALVAAAISWIDWRQDASRNVTGRNVPAVAKPAKDNAASDGATVRAGGPELGEIVTASNDASAFAVLPGAMPGWSGDDAVVRVQMQRSALSSLGLTVNEERASDWIQVDLLVGDDGQPQAVRLPQSTSQVASAH